MRKQTRAGLLARATLALGLTVSALAGAVATASPAAAYDVQVCGFLVDNVMWDKFVSRFGQFSACPTTNSVLTPNRLGLYVHFNNGASVYWKHTEPGAQPHIVEGLIRGKWASLGWENSILGFPTTDELPAGGGTGRFNHFEGGSIYWTPETGANTILGDIRNKWASLGWEHSFLGFPATDETATPDTLGRYNHFQYGSIYWKNNLGPHEIHGLIRGFWADGGWEQGALGYPISDELPAVLDPTDRFSDFENGVALWDSSTNSVSQLAPFQTISGADILNRTRGIIEPVLAGTGEDIYIRSGLTFAGAPADYYRDGAGLHNRQVRVKVPLEVDVSGLPNPTIDLTLYIEINLNSAGDAVVATLRNRSWSVHVPFPTSIGVSASTISNKIRAAIDPWLDRENLVQTVPIRPLSVKVMSDNTVQAFVG